MFGKIFKSIASYNSFSVVTSLSRVTAVERVLRTGMAEKVWLLQEASGGLSGKYECTYRLEPTNKIT
jgi:hypothetical protein